MKNEKKKVNINLGIFVLGIITIILLILVITIMGFYIVKKNNITVVENKEHPTSVIIEGTEYKDIENIEYYLDSKNINNYYNKEYSVYAKNEYLGDVIVEPKEGGFDGTIELWHEYVNPQEFQILIDLKFDAIPRKSEKSNLTEIMKKNIEDIRDYSDFEVEKIDLDGNNKDEYIIILKDKENNNIGKSKVIIVNEEGKKIADLVNIKNGHYFGYEGVILNEEPIYMEVSDLIYIDLDNDGKMEIITNLPSWEGINYKVFKYDNNKIIGNMVEMDYLGP